MLTLLKSQKEEARLIKSKMIAEKLFQMSEFKSSLIILFYASVDGEVNTFEMMKQAQKLGKKIALPQVIQGEKRIKPALVEYLDKDLEDGPYGIKQPRRNKTNTVELDHLDMVIVPGLAFDKRNNRLGRGAGYYDRFLQTLPSHVPTVGLAFDFQIVDYLPQQQEHDIALRHVIAN